MYHIIIVDYRVCASKKIKYKHLYLFYFFKVVAINIRAHVGPHSRRACVLGHIRYIGYRFPLSLSTIWGNHLPFNSMFKFSYLLFGETTSHLTQ